MSSIPEASLSILASNLTTTPWSLLCIVVVGGTIYYASPMRLTSVLVTALADTEKTYLATVENGVLSASTEIDAAERLSVLQLKVSTIRETSLRSSLSALSALCDTFNIRRSVAVLRCLREVRKLGAYIEISNETQLREINSRSLSNHTTISLRRRATVFELEFRAMSIVGVKRNLGTAPVPQFF
ncbi:hypothetical protein C8R45DRAFT_1116833 [Mycena sanguinolenta]|nr:hypothetical protein C8R45DRAFT_1116833 [Mycena sanguinolenta]